MLRFLLCCHVQDALLEERKPALTDEEESGSSTSSCDEIESGRVDGGADSDTASAPSPLQNSGNISELSVGYAFIRSTVLTFKSLQKDIIFSKAILVHI